jgi:uncharacterized protein YprB with RNaseH-like and TPR domain
MLTNTFCQVPGIGTKTEKLIWNQGVLDWEDFKAPYPHGLSRRKISDIKSCLLESQTQLADHNPDFFARLLPSNLHWRLFPAFRHATAYLDIETTGMAPGYDSITTIALYDGRKVYWYVDGKNLAKFKTDIQKYKVIVSYNGKSFDVPFIERDLGVRLDQAHIDLRHVLASLGYKGGLKQCEILLGMDRGELSGVDGYMAVLLWHDYQRNHNKRALDTLLAYNIQDAVTLENLMLTAYNLKLKGTPFADSHRLPPVTEPLGLFRPDPETIARILPQHY